MFHPEEQEFIQAADDPFTTVWRMWSMKESAYKLFLQSDKKRLFNPSSFICRIISPEKGVVAKAEFTILTSSMVNPRFIFTVATLDHHAPVDNAVFYLADNAHQFQRKMTHQKVLQNVSESYKLDVDMLKIGKTDQNIPSIYYKDKNLNIPVSLTHHGHFGAYSCTKVNNSTSRNEKKEKEIVGFCIS